MRHELIAALTAAGAMVLATTPASAGVIFDDGAVNGTINGSIISVGSSFGNYTTYDTFTATGSGTLDALTVGIWVFAGETPTRFDWQLGSTYNNSSIAGGTAILTPSDYTLVNPQNAAGFAVYDVTLTGLTSGLMKAGTTYVLTLSNGNNSFNTDVMAWDVTNGPAVCGVLAGGGGTPLSCGGSGGEAFTLFTAAPEPSIWALMLGGFAGLGGALRARRRSKPAAA
jgi:hypothetical protein